MKQLASILFFLIAVTSKAQFMEKHNYVFNGASYEVFVIKADSSTLYNASIVSNYNATAVDTLLKSLNPAGFFSVSCAIVDSACKPLGLLIQNGNERNALNTSTQGAGNFYNILPNGVFFVTDENKAGLVPSAAFNAGQKYKCAIQTGPCLVINHTINTAFSKNSTNKFMRTGVGTFTNTNGDFLVFAKSDMPVSFFEFAEFFLDKYNCTDALNFQSGARCSIHLPSAGAVYSNTATCCTYFVLGLQ